MRRGLLTAGILLVSFFGISPVLAGVQSDNVTVTSPNGGQCLQAGAMTSISWTKTAGIDNVAIGYRTDGGQPGSWSSSPSSYFAHPISGTSYTWTLPAETSQTVKVWIDGHAANHTSLTQDASDTNLSIDNSPPTAPTLSSSDTTTSSISLSFTVATDAGCESLSGYKLLRNNQEIATLDSATTTYTDTGLTAATSYTYKVQAYDDFATTTSNELSVTTDTATSSPTPTTTSTTPTSSSTQTSTPTATTAAATTTAATASSPTAATTTATSSPKPTISLNTAANQALAVTAAFIKQGEILHEVSLKEMGTINPGQTLLFEGTGHVGDTLLGKIVGTTTERDTTVGPTATWQLELDPTALAFGTYQISLAQKTNTGGLEGEQAIFSFIYQEETFPSPTTPVAAATQSSLPAKQSRTAWYLSLILLLILALLALLAIRRRHRQQNPKVTT